MRYPSLKSILASGLVASMCFSFVPTNAAVYDVSGIPTKGTGDAFTAAELNLMVDMLRNLKWDDQGDANVLNNRLGIGIAGTPGSALEVGGTVDATAFVGDGSGLTNLPNPGYWTQTSNDIYYNTGNVAIGINSGPTYQLEVHNTAGDSTVEINSTGGNSTLNLTNDSQTWEIVNNNTTGDLQIVNTTTGTTVFNIDNSTGDITNGSGDSVGGKFVDGTDTDDAVYTVGSVGIGTTNPATALLEVVGNGTIARFDTAATSGQDVGIDIVGARNGSTAGETAYIDLSNYDSNEGSGTEYTMARVAAGMNDVSGQTGFLQLMINDGSGVQEAVRVDKNGNVGIGTIAPSNNLEVASSLTSATSVAIANTDTGGRIYSLNSTGSTASGGAGLLKIVDQTAAQDRLVIDESGNVGIGTASPDGLLDLTLGEGLYFTEDNNLYGTNADARLIRMADSNGTGTNAVDGGITFQAYSNTDAAVARNVMTLRGNGRMGIGTITPSEELHLREDQAAPTQIYAQNESTSTNTNTRAGFGAKTEGTQLDVVAYGPNATGTLGGAAKADAAFIRTISGEPASSLNIGNGGAVPLNLFTGDTPRLTIDGSGNVGIGTTNPTIGRLQVENGTIALDENDNGDYGFITQGGPGNGIGLAASSATLTIPELYVVNGDVGIGDTSPDGTLKLDVEGPIGATQICAADGTNCINQADLGSGKWQDAATAGEIYYNGGNVGIRNTNPGAPLEVTGQSILEGDVVMGDSSNGSTRLYFNNQATRNYFAPRNAANDNWDWGQEFGYHRTNGDWYFDGNVGFGGIHNASEEIHLRKDQNAPTTIAVQNTSTGTGTATRAGVTLQANAGTADFIQFGSNATGSWGGQSNADATMIRTYTSSPTSRLVMGTGSNTPINLATNNATRMTILGNGNVGIGDETPGTQLEVAGAVRLASAPNAQNIVNIGDPIGGSNDGYAPINLFGSTLSGWGSTYMGIDSPNGVLNVYPFSGSTGGNFDQFDVSFNNSTTGFLNVRGRAAIGANFTPSEELHVRLDQTSPTTMAVQNASTATGSDVRAGVTLQTNGAGMAYSLYGTGASGSLGGQTRADAALIRTNSGNPPSKFSIGNGANVPLHLFTSDVTRMTINGSGNVGIGTTSPVSKLSVYDTTAGDIFIARNNTNAYQIEVGTGASSAYVSSGNTDLSFETNDVEAMRIKVGTNRVGIGTTNPEGKLHIKEDSGSEQLIIENRTPGTTAAPQYAEIQFNGYIGEDRARIRAHDFRSSAHGGALEFLTATGQSTDGSALNSAMYIGKSGNVGIGENSPVAKLHIDVGSGETGILLDGGTEDITVPDGQILQMGHLNTGSGAFTERLRIDNSGNTVARGRMGVVDDNVFNTSRTLETTRTETSNGAAQIGIDNYLRYNTTQTANRTHYGIFNKLDLNGSKGAFTMSGIGDYSEVEVDGATNPTIARSYYGLIDHNGTATMASSRGIEVTQSIAAGSTITTATGVYVNMANSGTVTNNYGIYINDVVEGTMSNAYSLWINEADVVLDGDGNGIRGGNNAGIDLFFGEGSDAAIWYDGTDLNIDPDIVGSGQVEVRGDLAFQGDLKRTSGTFRCPVGEVLVGFDDGTDGNGGLLCEPPPQVYQ